MISKKDTKKITVIYSIILILGLGVSFFGGNIPGLDKAMVKLSATDFVPNIGTRILNTGDNNKLVYESDFGKVDVSDDDEIIGVLIPRFASNGYMVYLNGVLIGQYGYPDHGTSNLWNSSAFLTFSSKLLKDNNSLRIVSTAEYKTGLMTNQIYIMSYKAGVSFQNWFGFFNHILVYAEIGILIISAAFMILMAILSREHRIIYFCMAIGMLSIGMYAIDYTPIVEMPFNYFYYKKIIMISFWTATMFYGFSIGRLFKFRLAIVVGIVGFIGIVLIALFSKDMIQFRNAYKFWYISQFINVITWIVATARVYRSRIESRVFIIGLSVLGIYSAINMVMDISDGFFLMNSPILYMAVFSVIPLMIVYFDVLNREELLRNESELRKTADNLANRDGLTDVYNKRYFEKIIKEFTPPYTLVIFDIDDFKYINDCYGHQAGDKTLIYLVNKIYQHMENEEILCRIGGDEFVMLLSVPVEMAISKIEDFKRNLQQEPLYYLNSEINFTVSFGLYYVRGSEFVDKSIRYADKALYESKKKGKNQITVYQRTKIQKKSERIPEI